MTAANMEAQKRPQNKVRLHQIFLNKHFYLHFRCESRLPLATSLVTSFGGLIEPFLEADTVQYLLTDIPQIEWSKGEDSILHSAIKFGIKPMSYNNLASYCKHYLTSLSNSDDEEAAKVQATELKAPYIKYENCNERFAPTVKELVEWPKINLPEKLVCGQSIFSFGHHSTQPPTPRPTNCTNTRQSSAQLLQKIQPHQRRNRHVHCELCNLRFDKSDKIDEHLESPEHQAKVAETNWDVVESVIESLPSIESLITPQQVQSSHHDDDQESFVCLHKLETVDRLFTVDIAK